MRGALLEDYGNPTLLALAGSIRAVLAERNVKVPLHVAFDAGALHLKRWVNVVVNPWAKGAWKEIVERYWSSDAYRELNEVTAGEPLLAKYAAVRFIESLVSEARKVKRKLEERAHFLGDAQLAAMLSKAEGEGDALGVLAVVEQLGQVDSVSTVMVREVEVEMRRVKAEIEAAVLFSHYGAPTALLLEKPDTLRRMMANRMVVNLLSFLRRLRDTAPAPVAGRAPTLTGGRPVGVRRMLRWSELPRVLPQELADEELHSYKLVSRTLMVRETYGGVPAHVIYLDKSGSMGELIEYHPEPGRVEKVEKISFAAASALALVAALRRRGVGATLKLFDTDVHDPVTDFVQLVDTLLRIRADSGTNITRVLEDAVENHRDARVIVVTDGVDVVSPEAVKRAVAAGLDATFVFIKTDNELLRKSFRCVHLKEARPEVLLEV